MKKDETIYHSSYRDLTLSCEPRLRV